MEGALAGDEGGTTGGAYLLAIVSDEDAAFLADAVDVRRGETHERRWL